MNKMELRVQKLRVQKKMGKGQNLFQLVLILLLQYKFTIKNKEK